MGSSPKTVAAPDPIKTAQAQGQANVDAAKATAELNRYDEKSPFGNTTWSNDNGKWTSEFQMAPQLQGLLDQVYKGASTPQTAVDTSGLQKVGTGQDYRNANSVPNFNSANITDSANQIKGGALGLQSGIDKTNQLADSMGGRTNAIDQVAGQMGGVADAQGDRAAQMDAMAAAMSGKLGQSNYTASSAAQLAAGQVDRLKNLYGQDFNYDKLGAMPTASDATRKAVEDAYYKSQTSRLDPQFQQAEAEMRSRLANQGLTEGSEAYNRELQQFNMGRTDAYGAATNSAIMNSTSEMQKQFQMQMAARQQGVGEQNYVRELGTKEAQAAMGMYGAANTIDNDNRNVQANFTAGAGALGQAQQSALQGQGGMLTAGGASTQAQAGLIQSAAGLTQAQSGLMKDAASLEQMQAQTGSQLADAAGNRGAQAQAMDTTGRANQLNEMLQLRGLNQQDQTSLLNTLMALRTGAQVQAPGAGQVQVGAAPVAQSIYNSQQLQQDAANAKAGATNSTIGTLGSLGGMAMMATGMF